MFLNPPYNVGKVGQLEFVENAMECMSPGGFCIAICQMSTVIHPRTIEIRKRLLEHHTLHAVLSMPDSLFHPVGVVTCIIVFQSGTPHPENKETFFGYFKDDGYVKIKKKGRVDPEGEWPHIKKKWLSAYANTRDIAGLSIKKKVKPENEWCAEAYMETDFSSLSEDHFKSEIKKFVTFLPPKSEASILPNRPYTLDHDDWRKFKLGDLFEIQKGKRLTKRDMTDGNVPYIGASRLNNGITDYIGQEPIFEGGTITVSYDGSVGEAFYQPEPFWASDAVNVLIPRFTMNRYSAMFIVTIIRQEQYKFSYGRKWKVSLMKQHPIKLPVNPENEPDWNFMEEYIKTMPYTSNF